MASGAGGAGGIPQMGTSSDNTASFGQALAQLKATNAEVTALNAAMQIEQARHTVLNKAIDSMNESVVKAGSTKRA